MSFGGLLINSATISSKSITVGPIGDKVEIRAARHTSIPCRIDALSVAEREMLGRSGTESTHRVFIDGAYTGILDSDAISVDGVEYELTGVQPIQDSGGVHHYELLVRRYP